MAKRPFILSQILSIAGVQMETTDGEDSSIEHSAEFKLKMLKIVKELTNNGRLQEASELFEIYFPNIGGTNGKSRST